MIKCKICLNYFTIIFLVIHFSCAHSSKEVKEEAGAKAKITSQYPALGNEEITKLFAIVEKVDMIFYNLPMSVNQEDAASAKNTVLYISPAPAIMTNPCKPLGRLSFISDGVIVKEADIYSDTGCQYFIFMKDNKPFAANAMAESGIEFFKQILTQVQQRQNGQ